jgi:hypothetical protein
LKTWFEKNPRKTMTVFILILLLCMATGLEYVLSLKNRDRLQYDEGIKRAVSLREHHPFAVQEIYPDKVFQEQYPQHRFQEKYLIRIDENGFIIPSGKHEHPDVSIVFLGASTTECLFVTENVRFPYLSGVLMEKQTGLKINTYNGGRGGNNSLHSIDILLNKVVPMAPDLVVMMHNMNDLVILVLEQSYWNANPKRSPVITLKNEDQIRELLGRALERWLPETVFEYKRWAAKRIQVRGIRNEFKHLHGRRIVVDREKLVEDFRANLSTFIALCNIRGIQPVLMTQASRMTETPDAFVKQLTTPFQQDYGIGYQEFKDLFDLFNQTVREIGGESQVLVIDLDAEIPKTGDNIFDLIHYTETGSGLAASLISRELLGSSSRFSALPRSGT